LNETKNRKTNWKEFNWKVGKKKELFEKSTTNRENERD